MISKSRNHIFWSLISVCLEEKVIESSDYNEYQEVDNDLFWAIACHEHNKSYDLNE